MMKNQIKLNIGERNKKSQGKMTRILITGDREWMNETLINETLSEFHRDSPIVEIIHGGCRGADILGGQWAKENRVKENVFYANWKRLGMRAGPMRNMEMLKYLMDSKGENLKENEIDQNIQVLAFHNDIQASKGTRNMVISSLKKNVKTILIGESGKKELSLESVIPQPEKCREILKNGNRCKINAKFGEYCGRHKRDEKEENKK